MEQNSRVLIYIARDWTKFRNSRMRIERLQPDECSRHQPLACVQVYLELAVKFWAAFASLVFLVAAYLDRRV